DSLNAIRVSPKGGAYFVYAQYSDTLAVLRDLVSRFGGKSCLSRFPVPDLDEAKETIVDAFVTKAKDDLDRLATEIAAARPARTGKTTDIQALHRRFQALSASAAEHATLLNTSMEDTDAAMSLVRAQLGGLLLAASDGEDDEDQDEEAGRDDEAV